MKEQLLFWMGGEKMIDDAFGNIELAYLRMLGQELIAASMQAGLPAIISAFNNREGWCPIDGTFGVKLVRVNEWVFDISDLTISQI